MADETERRIIYLEVNASKAVDGSTALTRAVASMEKGVTSAGAAVSALEAASVAAGGAAQRTALDLATSAQAATGLNAAYRTTAGGVLELARATTAAAGSAQAQAAGFARLAEQRTVQASLAQTRALMDDVSRSSANLAHMYGAATVATTTFASAQAQAAGYAKLADQNLIAAATAKSRGTMGAVEAMTPDQIKAYYFGTGAAATPAPAAPPAAGAVGRAPLTAQQRVMLGYQFNDIFTSLAGGMNPAMIAAQQGPQITQVFGGIGNTLAAIPKPLLAAGGAALGAAGIAAVTSAMKDLSDAADGQKRRLADLLGSQQLAATAYSGITKQAIATGTAIADVSSRFSTFASATKGLGATLPQIMDLVATSGQLGKIGGSTPEETASGVAAISKALSASVVSGEALQAIFDAMPAAGRAIADGIGVSTSQLKLMAQQGDLTSQKVFTSLLGQTDKLKKDFDELPGTIGTVFSGLITQAEDLAARLYKAVTSFRIMTDRSKELGVGQGGGGPAYVDSRPNINYGTPVYAKKFNQADADALETDLAGGAMASLSIGQAVTAAADAAVLAGAKIANAMDPAATAAKSLQEQFAGINAGIKALAASSLDGAAKADQLDKMAAAAERLKRQIKDAGDAVTVASRELGLLAIDSVNDNTPAGMAIAARSRQLLSDPKNTSTPAQATDVARGELGAQAATAIRAATDAANAQDKLTAATGRGKLAMIEAQVEVAKLSFQFQYFGQNPTEEAIAAINAFGDATRKNLTSQLAAATIDASKPMIDDLYAIAAAMDVVTKGAYAMRRAEVEARAARNENGTGQLQIDVFDSQEEKASAVTLENLQRQIDLTNALSSAAGDVARQKQIQLDFDIKQAQENAEPTSRAAIAENMKADAISKTNSVMREGLADSQKQVDMAQQQLDLIRSGTPDYAAQLAMLQKRNDLLAKAQDLSTEENQKQIDLAGQKARIDEQIGYAKEAADATKRTWMNAYDNIQSFAGDTFYDIFSGAQFNGATAAQSLKNIFLRAFAEIAAAAVIKPLISPIFQAGQSLGIVPPGVGGAAWGGTPTAANSNGAAIPGGSTMGWFGDTFSGVGNWMKQPIASMFPSATPAGGFSDVGALLQSGQTGASAAASGISGFGGMSIGQGLGGIASIGMGAYQLANSKSTGQTIGGIGSMVGGVVSMLPIPGAQIIGPLISLASQLLPSLLGESDTRTSSSTNASLRYGAGGYGTSGGAWGPGADVTQSQSALGSAGTNITGLYDLLGGVKDSSKVWGMDLSSWTEAGKDWSYTSNATQLVDPNGNQTSWRMNEDDMMDTGAAQVAIRSILDGAVGEISASMKKAATAMTGFAPTVAEVAKNIDFVENTYERFGKGVLSIKPSFDAVEKQFKDMTASATQLGLALAPVEAEQKKATERLGQDYVDNLVDPVAAGLRAWEDEKASILENIDYIKQHTDVVVDSARITEALLRKEAAVKDQLLNGSISQLEDAMKRLMPGGDLANVDPRGTLAGLEATYQATRAQAFAGDDAAYQRIATEGTNYVDYSKSFTGGGADYNAIRDQVLADFQELAARAGQPVQPAPSEGGGTMASANSAQIQQLLSTIANLTAVIEANQVQLAKNSAIMSRFVTAKAA